MKNTVKFIAIVLIYDTISLKGGLLDEMVK